MDLRFRQLVTFVRLVAIRDLPSTRSEHLNRILNAAIEVFDDVLRMSPADGKLTVEGEVIADKETRTPSNSRRESLVVRVADTRNQ